MIIRKLQERGFFLYFLGYSLQEKKQAKKLQMGCVFERVMAFLMPVLLNMGCVFERVMAFLMPVLLNMGCVLYSSAIRFIQ
jgi:hypothetical protein